MKFGKEFTAQMVPEWQEAYMDYNQLKSILKQIQQFRQRNKPPPTPRSLKRKETLYRAFSGLTQRHHHHSPSPSSSQWDIESQPILVNSVHKNGSESYETTFLMASDEGGEYEMVYFRRLDDEFNKVEKFYRSKVEEVRKEADTLNKQMDAFIAFWIKVENPTMEFDRSVEMTRLASDVATSTAALSASTPRGAKLNINDVKQREPLNRLNSTSSTTQLYGKWVTCNRLHKVITAVGSAVNVALQFNPMVVFMSRSTAVGDPGSVSTVMEAIDEESTHHGEQSNDSNELEEERTGIQKVEVQMPNTRFTRPAPLEVLNRVRINNTLETPRSTIKGFLSNQDQTELNFTRKNLRKVEQQLKRAFVEFYQKLRLLKSYSFLNTLAFSKIMKKYDKITSRGAAKAYMRMVDNSYFGSNDEVTKLIERVEKTFIKHFANSNRSKGMSTLRPSAKKERHRITFSMGFFAGCTIALLVALILIVRIHKIDKHEGTTQYMATLFPLYSLFGFIVLHILMYAANIYFWRRYRVNYSFIFGFKKGDELGYREVLLLGFGIAVLALSCVLANLDMQIDQNTKDYKGFTELLPLILLLSLIVVLLCPFNVVYRSNRVFFLVCVFHCICAPFYKVTLPDFFLADQFTSQVQALRSFEFYICYYGWGDFKHRESNCKDYDVFRTFSFIVAAIPYWSRFLQCLRRLYEEKDTMQGYNGLKYFITIAAVCLRIAYTLDGGKGWQVLAWIFSIAAAISSTYWDLVIDWGLLQRHSKNRWLRDKLIIPQKSVYFVAMVLNVLLRFAWLQTILNFKFSFFHREAMISLFSSLEIIRRGIWNFFRLENEHLNNVGKYRAFKSVPLPFNYDEDDDKDD